jgi:5-formyltetrahydrofolate cyclo-ligase
MDQGIKQALSRTVLALRDALPEGRRGEQSKVIIESILELPAFRAARVVVAYVSIGSELQTEKLLQAVLDDAKVLLLPKVNRITHRLDLYRVRDLTSELAPGVWGIREPNPGLCSPVSAQESDFILVPGVAFNREGDRLGYGGGYYDRLLASIEPTPVLVAGAFSLQVVAEVPTGPNDRPVDLVVTECAEYGRLAHGR